jgi:cell division protein FtsQ
MAMGMAMAAIDAGEGRSGAAPRRPRAPAPPPAKPPSKLQAAHGVGLRAPVAGAVAALLAVLIIAAGLATGGRGEALLDMSQDAADASASALSHLPGLLKGNLDSFGWRVAEVRLKGATPAAEAEILSAVDVRPGASLTALDLPAIRARVEKVGWVASAQVIRLLPNTLEVVVVQRPLMAVWQHAGQATVVAANGAPVNVVDPRVFPTLPLIVGEGANTAAAAFLPILARHPAVMAKTKALIRVDDRRWNLKLSGDGVVLLPAEDEEGALQHLDALQSSAKILDLGLARIDLRDPEMVVVRPRGAPAPAMAAPGPQAPTTKTTTTTTTKKGA